MSYIPPFHFITKAALDSILGSEESGVEQLTSIEPAGALPSNEELLKLRMAADRGLGVIPAGKGSPKIVLQENTRRVEEWRKWQEARQHATMPSAYATRAPSPPSPSSLGTVMPAQIQAKRERANIFPTALIARAVGLVWIVVAEGVERIWPLLWAAEGYEIFVDHFAHWWAVVAIGVLCMCRRNPFRFSRLRK